jgi:biopolymer transport protein ExbB/TolQ
MKTETIIPEYLLTLTSSKSFFVFLGAFLAGSGVLVVDFYPAYVLPIVVFSYTALLYYSQHYFFISLSEEIKNSPYFLGFLFTLTCLIHIFLNIRVGENAASSDLMNQIIQQIGTALLTTICGLIGRLLLISQDRVENEKNNLWNDTTTELKENAWAYQNSQRNLLSLVEDFTTFHRQILDSEEKVSKKHIAVLSETTATLEKLSKDYPERIDSFLSFFSTVQNSVQNFIESTLPTIHSDLTKGTANQLEKHYKQFSEGAETVYQNMGENLKNLETRNGQFVESVQSTFKTIPDIHQKILDNSATKLTEFQDNYLKNFELAFKGINLDSAEFSEKMKETVEHVKSCNEVFKGNFTNNLETAGNSLKTLSDQSDLVRSANKEIFESLNDQASNFNQVFVKRLDTFQSEIKQIDQLIDSFIEITRKKIVN